MAAGKPEVIVTLKSLEVYNEIPTAKPMFSRSLNPMDLFPILSNNGQYPEMEVMTLSRPEIVITMQQKGLSVKFQR